MLETLGQRDSLFRRFGDGVEYLEYAVELGDFKKCQYFLLDADEDNLASVSAHLAFSDEESAQAGAVAKLDIGQIDNK